MTKKAKATFTVGQTIHVWKSRGLIDRETKVNLKEYEVTSVNGTSVYAKDKSSSYDSTTRFNRKTLKSESSMAFGTYHIILDVEAFLKEEHRKEHVMNLKSEIVELMKNYDNEEVLGEFFRTMKKEMK